MSKTKSDSMFFRCPTTVRPALEKCAESDERSKSDVIRRAVIQYLRKRGFLK